MDLLDFYNQRITSFGEECRYAHRRTNLFSLLRLLFFIFIPVSFFVLEGISLWLSISVALILAVLFGISVKRQLYHQQQEKVFEFLMKVNQDEIRSIQGDLRGFDGGLEFRPQNHRYAFDLDVFGESSLYSLVNRASTWTGRRKIAEWLLTQADVDIVIKRQDAVKELSDFVDLRQTLQSFCVKTPDLAACPTPLLEWFREPCLITKPLRLALTLSFFSIVSIIGIALAVAGSGYSVLIASIILNSAVGYRLNKEIGLVHERLSHAGGFLKMYSRIIGFIKERRFRSALLNDYKHCFFDGEQSASHAIKGLAKILERFDLRLNAMIGIPLNLLFFWDNWQLLSLERWKRKHGDRIAVWLDSLGEFEAVSSLANLSFNNKKNWSFPKIAQRDVVYNAKNLGHPLIPFGKRVSNDLSFSGAGRMLLVTGSNMLGKSTFLRTMGVNMILAGAGSSVCATECEVTLRTPFTSMRVADSLEENISTFYAELKRISEIIGAVDRGESVLILLDEVLRGTNSNDRHKGALAMLRQLIDAKAFGVMATHDLGLADRALILSGCIKPCFFDVQVDGDELYFDYKLHEGECSTLNASILMRKMGIDLNRYGNVGEE